MPVAALKVSVIAVARRAGFLPLAMAICALLAAPSPSAAQKTLKAIKERGEVRCGVSGHLPGFSAKDANGGWRGFSVDVCRALAAAIFDDPSKVVFTPLTVETGFGPLISGEIDVLARANSWTLAREAGLGIQFAYVNYFDGQGFMVRKNRGAVSGRDLNGTKVCVQRESTSELNLADYFRANKLNYEEVALANQQEVVAAYDEGRCDAITSDISRLHSERLELKASDDHVILPDVIAKEPLGPAVRNGDDQWLTVVKWAHFAMVDAEELGVSQKTLSDEMNSEGAKTKRLLGSYAALGEALGLSNDWVVRIIHHVGNYGEVYERNLGTGSKLAIPRGLNRLWNDTGLQYAPPMR
ncbi:amino acid ABC transporter substrate-binding protein [Bradyrhizobium iriomotense]|uniref:Amino acid ABC transporter substrate-binding protein n=1 Tax=Bradyrhizobium iriomotense TaxID=441950 RepID=A0ABQ6APM9_9BRAD|nr:amino acid ABC transporter substrate-binding protein [Bradyrhizobium iriomotense]